MAAQFANWLVQLALNPSTSILNGSPGTPLVTEKTLFKNRTNFSGICAESQGSKADAVKCSPPGKLGLFEVKRAVRVRVLSSRQSGPEN